MKLSTSEISLSKRTLSSQQISTSTRYRSGGMEDASTNNDSAGEGSNAPRGGATSARTGYSRLDDEVDGVSRVDDEKRLKLWQAYVHVVKGNIGPGCLSMPYTFSQGGLLPSIFIWTVFSPACIYCMLLLVWSKHKMIAGGGARGLDASSINFEQVGKYALGSFGGHLIELFVCFTQLGVCSIYFDFCSINLHTLVPSLSAEVFVALLVPLLVLMVLIRSAKGLVLFSSVAAALMSAVLLAVFAFVTPHLGGDLRNGPLRMIGKWDRIPLVFSNLAFAYEGIGLVLPIESAMEESGRAGFPAVLAAGMSTVALLLLLNGALCFIALGDVQSASITAALAGQGLDPTVVAALNWLATGAVLLTYPLQFLPPVQILEHLSGVQKMSSHSASPSSSQPPKPARPSRPPRPSPQPRDINEEEEKVGLINPADLMERVEYASCSNDPLQTEELVSNIDSSTRHNVLVSSIESGTHVAVSPVIDVPSSNPRKLVGYEEEVQRCLMAGREHAWVPFRGGLVVGTALLAHLVPNLGTLISLVGSVASTTLGLILPPLIHYRMCGGSYHWYHFALHGTIMCVGVLGGTLSFMSAFSDLTNGITGELD